MATQRTTYGKRERDRAKQAKAAAKREKRQDRSTTTAESTDVELGSGELLTPAQLFAEIEEVHRAFAAEEITHEDFEEKKAQLLARLPID
jgi:hypothetical protein